MSTDVPEETLPEPEEDAESAALSTNPKFLAIIERARAEIQEGKTISLEEMKSMLSDSEEETPASLVP